MDKNIKANSERLLLGLMVERIIELNDAVGTKDNRVELVFVSDDIYIVRNNDFTSDALIAEEVIQWCEGFVAAVECLSVDKADANR